MGVESVDIEFRARLDDFKKTLETIPGLTKKSARELTSAWTSEIKKAEKQSGDSIQDAAKEAEKLEKIATAIGGPIGDGIRQIGALAKGAGAGLGEMGTKMLAIGATAAVVMGAAYAVGSVLTNIEAYEGAITSLEARDLVTSEQVNQLRGASAGWAKLGDQASGFAVIVATKVSKAFTDFEVGVSAAIGLLQGGIEGATDAAREMSATIAAGAREDLVWVGRLNDELNEQNDRFAEILGLKYTDAEVSKAIADQERAQSEAKAAAAKRASEAKKAESEAESEANDITRGTIAATKDAIAGIAEMVRLDEMRIAGLHSMTDGAVAAALGAAEMEDAFSAANEGISAGLDALAGKGELVADVFHRLGVATKEDWAAAQADMYSTSAGFARSVGALADVISDNQARNLNKDSAEYRKNRKKQFAAHKAAAIAEATINTALSVTKTMSQYAYPINVVLGALTIAAGAATIGTIAAQKPQFYTGGMVYASQNRQPDAIDATLHDGEGVLTRRGVASVGGPEAVRAANAGQGSSAAAVVAVSMLDSRILGDVWSGSGPRGTGGLMARVDSRLHGGLPGRAPPRSR